MGVVIAALIITAVIVLMAYTALVLLVWLLPFLLVIGLFFLVYGIIKAFQKAKGPIA